MNSRLFPRLAISIVVILLGFTTSAQAGPPLICHPIEIGHTKSLPSVDWNQKASGGYDLKNLTRDTLAILDSDTPVLVRMETLRRATIYARRDSQVVKELLKRLHARAANSDATGHPEAPAWFDVGYLAETYKQWMGQGEPNPASGLEGYGWVKRAISLCGQDPQMEFAAALITVGSLENDHQKHVQKAAGGAKIDPLLARNLAMHFMGNSGKTASEMLAKELA